jgi:diguanylate cyclase (GGDEF)-like protein
VSSFDAHAALSWIQDNAALVGLSILATGFLLMALRRGHSPGAPRGVRPAAVTTELGRELRKHAQELEAEVQQLRGFFVLLPDLTKELNAIKESKKVPSLMIRMLEQIFSPRKILIFYADDRRQALTLVEQKGFSPRAEVAPGLKVGYTEGRIGWVARHRVTMDNTDFANQSRVEALQAEPPAHRLFGTELCAPMVHDNQLYGVLSIGGLASRPRFEKRMLEMVADLGSVALSNITLFNEIQYAANSDGLTRLFNKKHFLARLGEGILQAEKARRPLSLFIFDLDHFKKYNDTHGHLAGDECLKRTAQVVREMIRPDDVAARYGGEEFVIIYPNTDRQMAQAAAEKVRTAIESHGYTPPHPVNPGGKVTISGGVATYPDDGTGSADLLRKADEALYESKRQGRNRVKTPEVVVLSDPTL